MTIDCESNIIDVNTIIIKFLLKLFEDIYNNEKINIPIPDPSNP
jgi:hypothetical protein